MNFDLRTLHQEIAPIFSQIGVYDIYVTTFALSVLGDWVVFTRSLKRLLT